MRKQAGFIVLLAALTVASAASAEQITARIDDNARVALAGNTRPEARQSQNDRGAAPDSLMLSHMQLLLKRTPQAEQALEATIDGLSDPHASTYHRWLTAKDFGRQFGAGADDIATITHWLSAHGFTVDGVATSRMAIDFSGTVGAVRTAFATPMHYLSVKGKRHLANMRDPQVPAALAPAIAGIVSLNDFRPAKMYRPRPKYSFKVGSASYQVLVPADLATIYNLKPLFSAGITGKGQTIALIEDTDLYSSADWTKFRSTFGLSSYTYGKLTTVHPAGGATCKDPGVNPDDGEAALDVEWSSAAAPNAAVELASCADTNTTFGGLIALENIVNAAVPPQIVSISYGQCEAYNGAAGNAAYYDAYQQAAAEGISVFVSSGDEDAAECDAGQWVSFQGISVSGFASTPYNVAVGGTDFADSYAGTNGTYWGSTNSSTYGSALSYIPEIPWNDSCASALGATAATGSAVTYGTKGFCNTQYGSYFWDVVGGSGGPSGCATGATSQQSTAAVSGTCKGYKTPSWQKALVGLPANGVRNLPDVSLFAGDGIWGHYYVYCYSDPWFGVPCTGAPAYWSGAGGTSFAAPIMAGIQALVDQKKAARQGNPDPVYYSLAAAEYGAAGNNKCNSSKGKSIKARCVFHDVTLGDNDVNCTSAQLLGIGGHGITSNGAVNCYLDSAQMGVLSTSNTSFAAAYKATKGWDFSTGIGTVNASNLVNAWP
ncbi:MAG: S53 family peptidase [Rhizomicrobium sp.]